MDRCEIPVSYLSRQRNELMNTPSLKIDLYSDTVTRPTDGMREAMAKAEVGDEQKREDPTTRALEERVAGLLGKEAAVFLPSGTMCNQIAIRGHCGPGEEIILDRTAHVRNSEGGGSAALSGALVYPLEGERGIFTADQLTSAIRPINNHFPRSRLVVVEQTSNGGGGSVWPLEAIEGVCAVAAEHGLARHMDGARLLNAVVATGISADKYSASLDSVWIDFSKGLGAPVGGALAGNGEFIEEAWRWKHQFGGAMRQSGIIAAGALYSLEHHVDRLAEDHENASLLAEGLQEIEGITVEPVATNMVFFDVAGSNMTAQGFNDLLLEQGMRVSTPAPTRCRAVTHLDVSRSQIEEAVEIMKGVAAGELRLAT